MKKIQHFIRSLFGGESVAPPVSSLTDIVGLKPIEIKLVKVDYPTWKNRFIQEKEVLMTWLKEIKIARGKDEKKEELVIGDRVKIIHVGSTAVKDILAKPILDVMIGFMKVKELNAAITFLTREKECKLVYTMERNGFVMLVREKEGITLAHYHLTLLGSKRWKDMIGMRNVIRNHRNIKNAYSQLKENIASQKSIDRRTYTQQKGDFTEALRFRSEMKRL